WSRWVVRTSESTRLLARKHRGIPFALRYRQLGHVHAGWPMLFSPTRGPGGASVKGIGGARSGSVASSAVADAFARRREAGLALVECAEAVSATAADMAARF